MTWPVPNRWSDAEMTRLCEIVARHRGNWSRVAADMPGRSVAACKQAYNSHVRREKLQAVASTAADAPKRLKSWQDKRAKEKAAEAERLAANAHVRSVTSEFLGDPLPGRSALDKKRAGVVEPDVFDRRTMHAPKKPTLYTGAAR